jgi:hypothetical protein
MDTHRADHPPIPEKHADLLRQFGSVTGHEHPEIGFHGLQQRLLLHDVRQHDQNQNQHGNDGQQGIIGNGTGEQQALVMPETPQHLQKETDKPTECR